MIDLEVLRFDFLPIHDLEKLEEFVIPNDSTETDELRFNYFSNLKYLCFSGIKDFKDKHLISLLKYALNLKYLDRAVSWNYIKSAFNAAMKATKQAMIPR